MLRIDDIDRKIIASLVEDGRRSLAALGDTVGLSVAATKRRVDRLVRDGVIRGFTADVDHAALGWSIEAFVEVYCEGRIPPEKMRTMVAPIPEVVDAFTVTGDADGVLLVRCSDAGHLEQVLGRIRNHPGVTRTRSAIILSHL
ncbi:DNA-binding Lrp family transcriptional regulator [Friedmanniella endophytica]|uniref:DNA-binding Lrp family transcriptional regulator n=1 Tax=Microlunatus kandeliicorticis TaxID=1759536 RepID=A0A7W3IPX6_9ACTN|nr:Lrp/AsnC family transcriptional regulator [Microlunatus kandeliicorticis]MBA8793087.1 DNA-binding Lrp family transcriptional regulator [Microlunatus kandeliicorticis]